MTEHHDSKDTDSKDTPTTSQENASENAAPNTFNYVVDYWDDGDLQATTPPTPSLRR